MKGAIGVFDSGVGGLSVLSHIHQLLPSESLIYVADSAHMPYGCKPAEAVRKRCLTIAGFLSGQGAKAVVVACNTATAVAVHALRERLDVPVIGMEPPVKPAVSHSRSGVVGILATSGTVSSEKFNMLKERFAGNARLLVQPCPGLVECVETGDLVGFDTRSLLTRYLQPLIEQGVDTLVLGCTHYPFLIPLISEIVGDGIKIIDTGDAFARELKRQLELRNSLAGEDGSGRIQFWSSGKSCDGLVSRLWGQKTHVEHLDI